MVLTRESFEKLLTEAVASKSEHQFAYVLKSLRFSPDLKLKCFNNLSTFEKVLTTPDSRRFIELCIEQGSNFFAKNCDGIYPLHFAIESMCADNLNALLNSFDGCTFDFGDVFGKVHRATIINERFEGGNNYLHILVNRLMKINQVDVCKMIQLLVTSKCNPNLENDHLESPYGLFVKKVEELNFENELVLWKAEKDDVGTKKQSKKDFNFMMQLIEQFDENKFIAEFENFKAQLKTERSDSLRLLEAAVARNLIEVVNVLIADGACINGASDFSDFKLPPAFLACKFGYHRVLNVLLSDATLQFHCDEPERNLLHIVCSSVKVQSGDRQKCFEIVTGDERCSRGIINGLDIAGHSSLFYACQNGFDEFAKDLLRHGAYIGRRSIIESIEKKVLNEFLDESVKTSGDVREKDFEIHVDYRFLIDDGKNHQELWPAHLMSQSKVKDLVRHPVISSFLFFKWKRVDFLIYSQLLIYFCFMAFLGTFIITHFKAEIYSTKEAAIPAIWLNSSIPNNPNAGTENDAPGKTNVNDSSLEMFEKPNILALIFGFNSMKTSDSSRRKRSTDLEDKFLVKFDEFFLKHAVPYRFCSIGVCMMTLYEIIQCVMSFKRYFFKFSNWLDLVLLFLAIDVLFFSFYNKPENRMQIRAITILVIAAQTIELIANISFLSMSLHMAIFKRVCVTFMKTLSLYLILILAFAMSFYTLNGELNYKKEKPLDFAKQLGEDKKEDKEEVKDEDASFSTLFMSFITAVRMMLSDFDKIKLKEDDQFEGAIFLLFTVLITMVLFNLLTALAISDTRKILKSAELVNAQKRISILHGLEKVLSFFDLSFAKVFPEMSSIMFKPNDDRIVRVENRVNKTDQVVIFVKNAGKVRDAINCYATKVTFWKSPKIEVKLSNQTVEKFVAIAKTQREMIFNEF